MVEGGTGRCNVLVSNARSIGRAPAAMLPSTHLSALFYLFKTKNYCLCLVYTLQVSSPSFMCARVSLGVVAGWWGGGLVYGNQFEGGTRIERLGAVSSAVLS
jgi:hypothetical protein